MKTGSWVLLVLALFVCADFAEAQEVSFFSEATDATFYDQGIVDVNNLGESTFEHTYPPGLPQYNDKIPASTIAFEGQTSLKFNYTSAENGNWKATVYRNDWSTVGVTGMDSLAFYIYSENEFPSGAMPLIGIKAENKNGSGDVTSVLYNLSDYNSGVAERSWIRIEFPLNIIFNDTENSDLDFSKVKGVVFQQSEFNNTSRTILIDEIIAFRSLDAIPPVENFVATGYDSHAELTWEMPLSDLTYRVLASFDGGNTFELRGETNDSIYLDFVPEQGKNSTIIYRVLAIAQNKESEPAEATAEISDFSDDELLDMFQRYTFRYFWEGAHEQTGMALERSNGNGRTAASGATGMGLMAVIAAHEREFEPRDSIKSRVLKILDFLENCERHHGAWSHWYNADTGKTQPFSADDDGGDIVETSYVAQALVALKNYFSGSDSKSAEIREKSNQLWREIDWDWYRQNGQNVLYWHWSPNFGFQKNMKVSGWNECLVTYIMAASSPTQGIPKEVYEQGWARNGNMVNRRNYYDYEINLSPNWGGPLFFIHYSHLGINPHGLKDQYADYWQEHVNTALIHYQYAIDNPEGHENYGANNWGLTASDDPYGYTAHAPVLNDNGTVSPTAALASLPYTPEESMQALKFFYRERGAELFGKYGPFDAFNDNLGWVREAYLGIDQGPIVVMIENYRTGLLWNNVMKDADVQAGLDKLGFEYKVTTSIETLENGQLFELYPNPAANYFHIELNPVLQNKNVNIKIMGIDGKLAFNQEIVSSSSDVRIDCSGLQSGIYIVNLTAGNEIVNAKLLIQQK